MISGPRIAIASSLGFGDSAASLAHGFRKNGWDVCPIDRNRHYLGGASFVARVTSRVMRRYFEKSYNDAIIDTVRTYRPEFLLTVKGQAITSDTLRTIRRLGTKSVMYYPDYHFEHRGLDTDSFSEYDLFVTTKSFQVEYLEKWLGKDKVGFVHHGYSVPAHRPILPDLAEDEYKVDCLYIGNFSRYKATWMRDIIQRMPDLNLLIVGGLWKQHAAEFGLQSKVLGQVLWGDMYSRIIQESRINIAIHYGPAGPQGWEDNVSTRTFEFPACKGFMLHIDNDEVRDMYEVGEEIDVFNNADELCEKIDYYLKHPEKRRAMIERAYQRAVPAYSYDARASELLALFKERL